jgi:hypothetical protein
VLSLKHSLHRKVTDAPMFYVVYAGLIAIAAALVVIPGVPLGLLTNAVQTLAGVLLPSATVFLLLLCNDKAVLGPWVNSRWLNLFTGLIIAVLVMLSIILTASVLYPQMGERAILGVLGGGGAITLVVWLAGLLFRVDRDRKEERVDRAAKLAWRMPPLAALPPAGMGAGRKIWMAVLRGYLLIAGGLVLVRIVQLALGGHALGGS